MRARAPAGAFSGSAAPGWTASGHPALGSLVVGIDFGVPALRALEWVADHLAPAAALHLVYVVDPRGGPHEAPPLAPAEVESLAGQAGLHLADLARALARRRCTTEVRVGVPGEELVACVGERDADVVVIGPHTHPGTARRGLGETAERLLACSAGPVLVGGHVHLVAPRRVVAALGDSALDQSVLGWARTVAAAHDADLGLERVGGTRSREGARAGHRLVGRVAAEPPDLLVLGGAGARSQRFVVDATARSILGSAPCPVLFVPERPGPV